MCVSLSAVIKIRKKKRKINSRKKEILKEKAEKKKNEGKKKYLDVRYFLDNFLYSFCDWKNNSWKKQKKIFLESHIPNQALKK